MLTLKALRACEDFGVSTLVLGADDRQLPHPVVGAGALRCRGHRIAGAQAAVVHRQRRDDRDPGAHVIAGGAEPSPLTVATDPAMSVQISAY